MSVSTKSPQLKAWRSTPKKTKLITNDISGINTEIKINGQKLETVTSFKYLVSIITDEGSKPEILSRIAQTTAALTRLKPVLNDRSISLNYQDANDAFPCHSHLLESLWIIDTHRRAPKKNASYGNEVLPQDTAHLTNEEVHAKIQQAIGSHEDLLTIVKRRKLQWYGHVSRSSGLAKTILQDSVK